MQILRYNQQSNDVEEFEGTEIVNIDKDDENLVTVYTNGGEFYIVLTKQDIQAIWGVFNGPTVEESWESQTLKREQGDFS
jgi:hypothetical protein